MPKPDGIAPHLEEWGNIIRRQLEENERRMLEYLRIYEEGMPTYLQSLATKTPEELFEYMEHFAGGRSDPRETAARQKCYDAAKEEILRRLKHLGK